MPREMKLDKDISKVTMNLKFKHFLKIKFLKGGKSDEKGINQMEQTTFI